MKLKEFRSKYLCVVNPHNRKVYDFKKKRQVRLANPLRSRNKDAETFPMIGYLCEECREYNNKDKLYLVNGRAVHENCGLKIVNGADNEKSHHQS